MVVCRSWYVSASSTTLLGGQEGRGKMTVEVITFIRGGFAF